MTHAGESRHDETGSRRERRADRNGGAETKRVDRRRFLVGTAAAAAGLAGYPTDLGASRSFSATPVVLPPGARSEAGCEQVTVETISSEESMSVSDVEYEVTIESHLSVYEPTGQPLADAEAPAVAYPGDGPLVGAEGHFPSESLAGGLSAFLDALPRFVFK